VGLHPVPCLAEFFGKLASARRWMFGNKLANEDEVVVGDYPVPVLQLCFHADNVAESLLERKSFQSRADLIVYAGTDSGRQAGGTFADVGSPPMSSTCNWCAATPWVPSVALAGQKRNRPVESRFWHSQNPCPSYPRILIAVRPRFRETNNPP